MKPIWWFVGLILIVMGAIIFITGIYYLFNHAPTQTKFTELHPCVWWGGIMLAVGLIYVIKNKNVKIE